MANSNGEKTEHRKPKLAIIFASTRPGRRGLPIAQWAYNRAAEYGAFDPELIDLAEVNLPFMDEPNHPRLRQYTHEHTWAWSGRIDAADAFIIVTPEYNYGMVAPLKNAIDYLHQEWQYKPVGFVSYGGVAAGTRAVQMTKQVVSTLKMVPLFEAVAIPYFTQHFDEDEQFQPTEAMESSMTAMLNELVRVETALRPLRAPAKAPEPQQESPIRDKAPVGANR